MSDVAPGERGDAPETGSSPAASEPAGDDRPRATAGEAARWWDRGHRSEADHPGGDLPTGPPTGTRPVDTSPTGTPPVGAAPAPTPPWGTPPWGPAPAGAPPWGPPAGAPPWRPPPAGAPPWGPPPPSYYGWGAVPWSGVPQPAYAGPTPWTGRRRAPLPWIVVGSILAVVALVGIGLGIGFSVWGSTTTAASSSPGVVRPVQPVSPGIGSAAGRGGFLGVEIRPSAPFRPGAGATAPGTASSPGTTSATGSSGAGFAPGALVAGVVATSPAAKAGIVKGDTIVAFDGHRIATALTLEFDVSSEAPGQRAKVAWTTATGKHASATVTLAKRPSAKSIG